jgi:hypothetical protein
MPVDGLRAGFTQNSRADEGGLYRLNRLEALDETGHLDWGRPTRLDTLSGCAPAIADDDVDADRDGIGVAI